MNTENQKHRQQLDQHSKQFLSGGTFRWKKDQAQIRHDLLQRIAQRPVLRKLPVARYWAVAASILLLLGVTAFMRLYTTTVAVPAGIHQVAMLPDGSTVELNAESSLSYHPFWWKINRELEFEGEGYFEVMKGKKFTVHSTQGSTQVLGTSFNILSREEVYKVTCITGKVRVRSTKNESVDLLPDHQAVVLPNGQIRLETDVNTNTELSWKNNLFLFTAAPLRDVFKEIERQYAVTIDMEVSSSDLYTGNFNRTSKIEEVLSFVCPAVGLKFEKTSTNHYLVRKDNE